MGKADFNDLLSALGLLGFGVFILYFFVIKKKEGFSACSAATEINNLDGVVKIINIVENHALSKGWVVDDGYPSSTMLQFGADPPSWVKPLKPYDRIAISTKQPLDVPYIPMTVYYVDKGILGWTNVGSGAQGEDALKKCCMKNNQLDVDAFYKNYGKNTQIEEGLSYLLMADDGSCMSAFWVGINPANEKQIPYPMGSKMYVFQA